MSASEIGAAHIDVLLTYGMRRHPMLDSALTWRWGNPTQERRLDRESADRVGSMLLAENQRNLNHLYGEREIDDSYRYRPGTVRGGWVAVLKAISFLEYQCCDHPGWRDSEAAAFCEALRRHAIHWLDGWDEAPAEIRDADVDRSR
jgi:hypothetical protein